MKTLNPKTSPTLRRTCMVWRVGQGQAYLSTTVAVWRFNSIWAVWTLLGFICVLLWHQGQAYVWTPVAIWGFSFLVSSVLFSVMFWWHAHVVLLWDMPAVFCILYLSLYQSRVLTGTWHSPGFVGDSQLLPSILYPAFPHEYKKTWAWNSKDLYFWWLQHIISDRHVFCFLPWLWSTFSMLVAIIILGFLQFFLNIQIYICMKTAVAVRKIRTEQVPGRENQGVCCTWIYKRVTITLTSPWHGAWEVCGRSILGQGRIYTASEYVDFSSCCLLYFHFSLCSRRKRKALAPHT